MAYCDKIMILSNQNSLLSFPKGIVLIVNRRNSADVRSSLDATGRNLEVEGWLRLADVESGDWWIVMADKLGGTCDSEPRQGQADQEEGLLQPYSVQ